MPYFFKSFLKVIWISSTDITQKPCDCDDISGNDDFFFCKNRISKIHSAYQIFFWTLWCLGSYITCFLRLHIHDNAKRFVVDLLTDLPIINQVLQWAKTCAPKGCNFLFLSHLPSHSLFIVPYFVYYPSSNSLLFCTIFSILFFLTFGF